MPALFVFLLKVNIALLLFCAGYYLILRPLTFYTLNRVYLLAAIVFASVYPQINLQAFVQQHEALVKPVAQVAINWQPIQIFVEPINQPDYWQWAAIVFWIGAAVLAIRLAMQLFSLFKLYKNSRPEYINNHLIRVIDQDAAPFSFWRSIYLNPKKHEPADLKAIILHEQVHVNQWHTADILLAELSSIFYWFNPGIWLIKKAVRENIEFITDQKILKKGIDSKAYQYSLVNVSFNSTQHSIVNHFNISTIKKRIIMMNAKRSSKFNLTRYAFVVPAVIVLLLVFGLSKADFARPVNAKIMHAMSPLAKIININVDETVPVKPVKANVKPTHKITLPVAAIKRDTVKKLALTAKSTDSTIFVINGVKGDIKKIDPVNIQSIRVLAGADALPYTNKAGADSRVVYVVTKDAPNAAALEAKFPKIASKSVSVSTITSTNTNSNSNTVAFATNTKTNVSQVIVVGKSKPANAAPAAKTYSITSDKSVVVTDGGNVITSGSGPAASIQIVNANGLKIVSKDGTAPLIIVDGKKSSTAELQKINQSDIENVNVFKGDSASKLYGDEGKNGVVLISTSAALRKYEIDGKKATKADFKKLNPSDISTVNIMKSATAKDTSVISITTNKKQ